MKELPLSICAILVKMALGRAEAERAAVETSLSGLKDGRDQPAAAQEETEDPKTALRRRARLQDRSRKRKEGSP
jgi:hypothetical protein